MPSELLTPNQEHFAGAFARETGLNPRVVGAWLKAEQSGSAAKYYEDKGYNNWLNIAQTDSGPAGGAHSSVWTNPESAAKASAEWMRGHGQIAQEYGAPSEGIRNILHARGAGAEDQIKAIAGSGWASSGYNHGNTLRQLYGELSGHPLALQDQVEGMNTALGIKSLPGSVGPSRLEPPKSNPIEAIRAIKTQVPETRIPGEPIPEQGNAEEVIQKNWQGLEGLFEPHTESSSPISRPLRGNAPALRLPGENESDTERTLHWATQHLGKFAESSGPNLGPELNKLERQFGMTGEPWCAIFATTAAAQGGMPRAGRTASVAMINQWAEEGTHGYTKGLKSSTEARGGDLLTFGDQHVALVKDVRNGLIHTLEGNADGSGGVVELTHTVGEGQIARPIYGRG
jgi:hypothetical protein